MAYNNNFCDLESVCLTDLTVDDDSGMTLIQREPTKVEYICEFRGARDSAPLEGIILRLRRFEEGVYYYSWLIFNELNDSDPYAYSDSIQGGTSEIFSGACPLTSIFSFAQINTNYPYSSNPYNIRITSELCDSSGTPTPTPTPTPSVTGSVCNLNQICVTVSGVNDQYSNFTKTYYDYPEGSGAVWLSLNAVQEYNWDIPSDFPLFLRVSQDELGSFWFWQFFHGDGIFRSQMFREVVCPISVDNGGQCVYTLVDTADQNYVNAALSVASGVCANDPVPPTPTPTVTPTYAPPTPTVTPTYAPPTPTATLNPNFGGSKRKPVRLLWKNAGKQIVIRSKNGELNNLNMSGDNFINMDAFMQYRDPATGVSVFASVKPSIKLYRKIFSAGGSSTTVNLNNYTSVASNMMDLNADLALKEMSNNYGVSKDGEFILPNIGSDKKRIVTNFYKLVFDGDENFEAYTGRVSSKPIYVIDTDYEFNFGNRCFSKSSIGSILKVQLPAMQYLRGYWKPADSSITPEINTISTESGSPSPYMSYKIPVDSSVQNHFVTALLKKESYSGGGASQHLYIRCAPCLSPDKAKTNNRGVQMFNLKFCLADGSAEIPVNINVIRN